jgi:hypothetical protein
MPCELELKSGGRVWGLIRAEVSPEGEVLNIDIKPTGKPTWSPFCQATVIDVPNVGPQLAFRMFGAAAQKGEIDASGNVTRTA